MTASDDFLSLFNEQGCYKNGMGEVTVVYLTNGGSRYPGRLQFKNGLLVSAEMDGFTSWRHPDESPLDGLKFLLQFSGEKPRAVFVEKGRVVHNFELQDQASKEQFLANFRVARNLFVHSRIESDSTTVDTDSISDALTRAALWLTPKSVEGFNATDFPELQMDQQDGLRDAVQAFTAIVRQVPADKVPTKEQYADAATAFFAILKILSPYLLTPEESKKVEKALRKVQFPSWVVNWDYELGSSEEGDPAVWVDIFVDGNVARSEYGRFGTQIVPKIREALATEGVPRWPYIRLRIAAEYKVASSDGPT